MRYDKAENRRCSFPRVDEIGTFQNGYPRTVRGYEGRFSSPTTISPPKLLLESAALLTF